MKIVKLKVENFENLSGSWGFPEQVLLTGKNGSGKSSIGRAIAFAVTGRDLQASTRVDHIMQDPTTATVVELELDDGTTIRRRKTTKMNKAVVKGPSAAAIESLDPVRWLCAFWPGFFWTLSEADQRSIFMDALPAVKRSEVWETLATDFACIPGIDSESYNPDKEYKKASSASKYAHDDVVACRSRIDELQRQIKTTEAEAADMKEPSAEDLEKIEVLVEKANDIQEEFESESSKGHAYTQWLQDVGDRDRAIVANAAAEKQLAEDLAKVDENGECSLCGQPLLTIEAIERVACPRGKPSMYPIPDAPGPEPEFSRDKISELKTKAEEIHREIAAAKEAVKARKQGLDGVVARLKESLVEAQGELSGAEKESKEFSGLAELLNPARGIEAEVLRRKLMGLPDTFKARFDIQIQEQAKTTDSWRPVFKVAMKDGDCKVPIAYCSAGQQIEAGVEISNFLDKGWGMRWLDNPDLLTTRPRFYDNEQVFMCFVGDQDLKISKLG